MGMGFLKEKGYRITVIKKGKHGGRQQKYLNFFSYQEAIEKWDKLSKDPNVLNLELDEIQVIQMKVK